MKYLALAGVCALVFGLSGCASNDTVSDGTPTAPKTSVPGQDVSGEGSLSPSAGPGGAAANVRF